jgi:hypothetical protein
MGAGPYAEIHGWFRHPKFREEPPGHAFVVMLTGVHDRFLVAAPAQLSAE